MAIQDYQKTVTDLRWFETKKGEKILQMRVQETAHDTDTDTPDFTERWLEVPTVVGEKLADA